MIRVEKLGTQHVLDGFDCGNDDLNDWLVTSARTATGHGTRTWLAFDVHSGELVGYFAVLPVQHRSRGPRTTGARRARTPSPAISSASSRCVSRRQGEHIGGALLAYGLGIVVGIGAAVPEANGWSSTPSTTQP